MQFEFVEITTSDGIVLRGECVRGTQTGVVMIHEPGTDIDVWRGLRAGLAERGCAVLALDLRGHGGSDGAWCATRAIEDISVAVSAAMALIDRGPDSRPRVSIVATGESGSHALLASAGGLAIDSLVLISARAAEGVDRATLRGPGIPKLFLYGSQDPRLIEIEALAAASIGWTGRIQFPTAAHGTELLDEWGDHVLDQIAGFVLEATLEMSG
jgi:pimeloyl-ACP methyl ester carboxylesterase